eukprot:3556793-Rhodomonas_salina.4
MQHGRRIGFARAAFPPVPVRLDAETQRRRIEGQRESEERAAAKERETEREGDRQREEGNRIGEHRSGRQGEKLGEPEKEKCVHFLRVHSHAAIENLAELLHDWNNAPRCMSDRILNPCSSLLLEYLVLLTSPGSPAPRRDVWFLSPRSMKIVASKALCVLRRSFLPGCKLCRNHSHGRPVESKFCSWPFTTHTCTTVRKRKEHEAMVTLIQGMA